MLVLTNKIKWLFLSNISICHLDVILNTLGPFVAMVTDLGPHGWQKSRTVLVPVWTHMFSGSRLPCSARTEEAGVAALATAR